MKLSYSYQLYKGKSHHVPWSYHPATHCAKGHAIIHEAAIQLPTGARKVTSDFQQSSNCQQEKCHHQSDSWCCLQLPVVLREMPPSVWFMMLSSTACSTRGNATISLIHDAVFNCLQCQGKCHHQSDSWCWQLIYMVVIYLPVVAI